MLKLELFHLQAEELNTIVGNAFRMAYVAQLQRQPILQDVISSRSTPSYRKDKQEHRTSWVRFNISKQITLSM